nr:bifunctional homocysteine S-methyltransferase/methylenetetrahydrofolate reductase [Verrucomicrobiota bacterium]
LLDGGCQGIFLETFQSLDELLIALEVKHSLHHCPVICSLACGEEGRLPNGTPLSEAFSRLRSEGADIVGVNCANGPQATLRLLERIPVDSDLLLSAFPNAGYPQYRDGQYRYHTSPGYFAQMGAEFARQGARLIGGCCGTAPAHIAALAETLLQTALPPPAIRVSKESPPVIPVAQPHDLTPRSSAVETSILDLIPQGRTVIVTELDPPKTLDLERFYAGARALQEAGSDAITLADNSLAILRVSNFAMAVELKRRGMVPLLHLSCRDRNLIGLQSELLGMAALGMRHVLPLTGDPAKAGDHPGATSVYDVTSIELIKIIVQFNAGLNANGKSLRQATDFVIGCTFNPGARNSDAQLARLERKLAAGARFVMTQPVFDTRAVPEIARRVAAFKVPILTGVWPLLHARQAEFLHNEVPGISIPEPVRESMRGLEDAAARERGLALARDVCRAVLDYFPGVYLITPFLHYEMTVELARFARTGG